MFSLSVFWMNAGDFVVVQRHQDIGVGVTWEGVVHQVQLNDILIEFAEDFPYNPQQRFDLWFELNEVPFKR